MGGAVESCTVAGFGRIPFPCKSCGYESCSALHIRVRAKYSRVYTVQSRIHKSLISNKNESCILLHSRRVRALTRSPF